MADQPNKFDGGLLVPSDRTFERTQGCWNCAGSARATKFWTERRQTMLQKAMNIAIVSGEDHPKCQAIRFHVDRLDHQVASGEMLRCVSVPRGRDARGNEVGDLVAHNYLCDRWRGATGASVARAGKGPDKLPEELEEILDGPRPKPVIDSDDRSES